MSNIIINSTHASTYKFDGKFAMLNVERASLGPAFKPISVMFDFTHARAGVSVAGSAGLEIPAGSVMHYFASIVRQVEVWVDNIVVVKGHNTYGYGIRIYADCGEHEQFGAVDQPLDELFSIAMIAHANQFADSAGLYRGLPECFMKVPEMYMPLQTMKSFYGGMKAFYFRLYASTAYPNEIQAFCRYIAYNGYLYYCQAEANAKDELKQRSITASNTRHETILDLARSWSIGFNQIRDLADASTKAVHDQVFAESFHPLHGVLWISSPVLVDRVKLKPSKDELRNKALTGMRDKLQLTATVVDKLIKYPELFSLGAQELFEQVAGEFKALGSTKIEGVTGDLVVCNFEDTDDFSIKVNLTATAEQKQ